jgi:uncharacterized protein (TIGR03032 family)
MSPELWQTRQFSGGDYAFTISSGLEQWLVEQDVSVAFTAPMDTMFLLGRDHDDAAWIVYRGYNKAMGLEHVDTETLYVAAHHHLWRFENVVPVGEVSEDGYDRVYVPLHASATGFINAHDVCMQSSGELVIVNTRFNCLCEPGEGHSNFVPTWWPPFLPGPVPSDRCHLNGLAMRDGKPAFVTLVSESNRADGWQGHRDAGGVVYDVATSEIIATGMSMPHSPRWHNGRLWVANAGLGEFGYIDMDTGRFEPVITLPGFVRGIRPVGHYAIVGTSKPRHGDVYSGLELDHVLEKAGTPPVMGLFVVDLRSGQLCEFLMVEGPALELFEVIVLPGVRRPKILTFFDGENRRMCWPDIAHESECEVHA